jgi:transposase
MPRGRGSSRFVGVSWDKCNRCWIVHISSNGKQRHVGCFKDEIAAARAYDEAARQAFGEFATPNFPTAAERKRAAAWFDRDAACRFFGVNLCVWKNWVRQGKVTGGRMVPSSCGGGKRKVYTLTELERMREELFGEDKLYKSSEGPYHVPEGFLRREEACSRFGVSIQTWWRWECKGLIKCGLRVPGGPKLYRVEDIERLVERHGFLSPPYPDPERPGCYRVPLGGHDITRREAIIDADSLQLIEGGSCHMAGTSDGVEFVSVSIDGEHTPLRRLIMGVTDRNQNIGHRNGDPLDCRRENLIVRTITQRSRGNRKMKKINGRPPTSKYKGVFWDTWAGKWRARINVGEKNYSLGRFHDEIEAAECYDIAARRLFGKHAWLNFPEKCFRDYADITQTRAAA